jgi:hypothetical protein
VHAIFEPVLNIPQKDVVPVPHKSTAKPGDLGETERPSFLSIASASISSACDPCELRPRLMPVPYTTMYAELSIDKRPFTTTHNSKTPTAAALKSVQILKQFWGDVEDDDSDTEDLTVMQTGADQYLLSDTETVGKVKRGKKNKKQKSPKSMAEASSARINTRSKKNLNITTS